LNLILVLFTLVQQTNPYANDAKAAEVGRGNFRLSCAPCHGLHAQGGRSGPDLTHNTYLDYDLFHIIANGVQGAEMPAFAGSLTPESIWRIVAFLRSSAQPANETPRGDRAQGKTLFWGKAGCQQCHVVGEKGRGVGPELTRIGRQRSLAHLRESIVSPNADPTPGYDTVTVVERDGTSVTGVEKGFDNFSVRLVDLSQNFHSFDRNDLVKVTRNPKSLMPDDYEKRLTASEVDDLVAYLASLHEASVR
jgi:putative heme-binding domain-containing protein